MIPYKGFTLIKTPTREDFIPGDLYFVTTDWSLYKHKRTDTYEKIEIKKFTPWMFIEVLAVDQGSGTLTEIMEILVEGDKFAYYNIDGILNSINCENYSLYKLSSLHDSTTT